MFKLNSKKRQFPHDRVDIHSCSTERGGKVPASIKWILSSCRRAGMMDYFPRRPIIPEYSFIHIFTHRSFENMKGNTSKARRSKEEGWGCCPFEGHRYCPRPKSLERWQLLWDPTELLTEIHQRLSELSTPKHQQPAARELRGTPSGLFQGFARLRAARRCGQVG